MKPEEVDAEIQGMAAANPQFAEWAKDNMDEARDFISQRTNKVRGTQFPPTDYRNNGSGALWSNKKVSVGQGAVLGADAAEIETKLKKLKDDYNRNITEKGLNPQDFPFKEEAARESLIKAYNAKVESPEVFYSVEYNGPTENPTASVVTLEEGNVKAVGRIAGFKTDKNKNINKIVVTTMGTDKVAPKLIDVKATPSNWESVANKFGLYEMAKDLGLNTP